MAKIPTFSEVSVADVADLLYLVDVSDTTDDATGSSRNMTLTRLFGVYKTEPGGRLTLSSGVPVPTGDVTGATTVYYTPYIHNAICLWDGTRWIFKQFSELSLALGTVTSGLPYDIFVYSNSGTVTLEKLAWTNTTTRATAITIQDGRYCKSGDKTRLYVGTIYTTSTTQTEDSLAKRFVWNMYNRIPRRLFTCPGYTNNSSNTSYTTTSATWTQANGGTGNKLECVIGLADSIHYTAVANFQASISSGGRIAISYDSTTDGAHAAQSNQPNDVITITCSGGKLHSAGYRYAALLIASLSAGQTVTFYADISGGALGSSVDVPYTYMEGMMFS